MISLTKKWPERLEMCPQALFRDIKNNNDGEKLKKVKTNTYSQTSTVEKTMGLKTFE